MDEGNCVTTLQLVRVYEPAVAPCCATLLEINTYLEGKWTSAASLAEKRSRSVAFCKESAYFIYLVSFFIFMLYFIPSAVCQETLVCT